MYCIYTGQDVPEKDGNWDHIFPLSLGGKNQFVVWSDAACNSTLGSKVDGVLARDPLLQFALRDSEVVGHNRTVVEPRWRNVSMDGKPIQVTWSAEGPKFWDSRNRHYIDESDVIGQPLSANLKIGMYDCMRFLAKVALGSGYFTYGVDLTNSINCDHLRHLMLVDVEREREEKILSDSGILICDRFHSDSTCNGNAAIYRALCEGMKRSIVISVPHDDAVAFHVGVVGSYIGSIVVPGTTNKLPIDGDHDLGHAIILGPGEMERLSFRELAKDFHRAITGEEPPPVPGPEG